MTTNYDDLETRTADNREATQLAFLQQQLLRLRSTEQMDLPDVEITSLADLTKLPVLRKSELSARQKAKPPFGGMAVSNPSHIFQSPGPLYEPGMTDKPASALVFGPMACSIKPMSQQRSVDPTIFVVIPRVSAAALNV